MILDIQKIKDILGIPEENDTKNDTITRMYYKALDFIESKTGSTIEETTKEIYKNAYNCILELDEYPITEIVELKYNSGGVFGDEYTALTQGVDYKLDSKSGNILVLPKYSTFNDYFIKYTTGYTTLTLPRDLSNLIAELSAAYYTDNELNKDRDFNIKSESVNGDSITFFTGSETSNIGVNAILNTYEDTISKYTIIKY